jgi:hypothetical protein
MVKQFWIHFNSFAVRGERTTEDDHVVGAIYRNHSVLFKLFKWF